MKIKQSVINTFKRVGIPYEELKDLVKPVEAKNWITGETCMTTPLLAYCIAWVYDTQLAYESGDRSVNVSDFDRVRYFVLDQDPDAYNTCLD